MRCSFRGCWPQRQVNPSLPCATSNTINLEKTPGISSPKKRPHCYAVHSSCPQPSSSTPAFLPCLVLGARPQQLLAYAVVKNSKSKHSIAVPVLITGTTEVGRILRLRLAALFCIICIFPFWLHAVCRKGFGEVGFRRLPSQAGSVSAPRLPGASHALATERCPSSECLRPKASY